MKSATLFLLFVLFAAVPARAQIQMPQIGFHHETTTPDGTRYQIIQSQAAAKWTFRLDRFTGQPMILIQNGQGFSWQVTKVEGLPDGKGASRAHYQMFVSGFNGKFMFLTDTDSGKTWYFLTLTDNAGKEVDYMWKPFVE